jgi:hypothetical protein
VRKFFSKIFGRDRNLKISKGNRNFGKGIASFEKYRIYG